MLASLPAQAERLRCVCVVYLAIIVFVLSDLPEQLDGLLHQVLLDDLKNLVLLQGLARDVQGQILRVHHTLHERQVLEFHTIYTIAKKKRM